MDTTTDTTTDTTSNSSTHDTAHDATTDTTWPDPGPGRDAPIRWRESPIDRSGWITVLVTFCIGTVVTTAIGLAIVEWWDTSSLGEADADLNRWLEDRRTPARTTFFEYVSQSSDTITKVILGVVLIPVFLWLFRRWHEYAVVFGGLVLEVCVFGLSSSLVGRARPPVEQLDGAPTDSFPSGHIAAATVFFGGLAVIVFMQTARRGPRFVAAVVGVVMPVGMAVSRLYLGMHYVTDAIAGITIGVVVLVVMYRVVHRTLPAHESPARHDRVGADSREPGALAR